MPKLGVVHSCNRSLRQRQKNDLVASLGYITRSPSQRRKRNKSSKPLLALCEGFGKKVLGNGSESKTILSVRTRVKMSRSHINARQT